MVGDISAIALSSVAVPSILVFAAKALMNKNKMQLVHNIATIVMDITLLLSHAGCCKPMLLGRTSVSAETDAETIDVTAEQTEAAASTASCDSLWVCLARSWRRFAAKQQR